MLIQSMEDIAIRPDLNLEIFEEHMQHPRSGALVFRGKNTSVNPVPGLSLVESYLPADISKNLPFVAGF